MSKTRLDDRLVDNLSMIRSKAVAIAYIFLHSFEQAEEAFMEMTVEAAAMQREDGEGLYNFRPWFWDTYVQVLVKRVEMVDHPGILQQSIEIEGITRRFLNTVMPPKAAYKDIICAVENTHGKPLEVFKLKFYEGKNCRQVSERLNCSQKSVMDFLDEAKEGIRKQCHTPTFESGSDERYEALAAEEYLFDSMGDRDRLIYENYVVKDDAYLEALARIAYEETRLRRVAKHLGKAGKLVDRMTDVAKAIDNAIASSPPRHPRKSKRAAIMRARAAKRKTPTILIGVIFVLIAVIIMIVVMNMGAGKSIVPDYGDPVDTEPAPVRTHNSSAGPIDIPEADK